MYLSNDHGGSHVEFGRESVRSVAAGGGVVARPCIRTAPPPPPPPLQIRALALLAHRCPAERRADVLYRGLPQLVCVLLGQSPAPLAKQQAAYLEQTAGNKDTLATLPRLSFALLRRLLCASASQVGRGAARTHAHRAVQLRSFHLPIAEGRV